MQNFIFKSTDVRNSYRDAAITVNLLFSRDKPKLIIIYLNLKPITMPQKSLDEAESTSSNTLALFVINFPNALLRWAEIPAVLQYRANP